MKIFVEQLEFTGHHGVYDDERREGRRFRVDLEVDVDDGATAGSDRLDETVDYAALAEVVDEIGSGKSRRLVETLAEEMIDAVLERFAPVRSVNVRLRKHAPDVAGNPRWVGVELTKRRTDGAD